MFLDHSSSPEEDGDEEDVGEFAVRAGKEGAPLVCVAKDVAAEGERDTRGLWGGGDRSASVTCGAGGGVDHRPYRLADTHLYWNMPSALAEAQNHSRREQNAPYRGLEEDVNPEDRINGLVYVRVGELVVMPVRISAGGEGGEQQQALCASHRGRR